jgi:hypothetical protein
MRAMPAAVLALLAACGGAGNSTERTETMSAESRDPASSADVARITAAMGIDLPASATVDYAEYIEGVDDATRLMVTMPQADWEAMKAAPPIADIDPRAWAAENVVHLGPDAGAWQPEATPGVEAAQMHIAEGRQALNVGFVPADGGTVRVYFHWFQL